MEEVPLERRLQRNSLSLLTCKDTGKGSHMAQWKQIRLATTRMQVRPLAVRNRIRDRSVMQLSLLEL